MLAPTHSSLGGLGETTVASRLALYDRLGEPALDILKHLCCLGVEFGRHVRVQSPSVLGLISMMFDGLF
jgi:hypothetical protein